MRNKQSGFTLTELLLAIAIVAILLTAGLVAVNPATQFAKAHNIKRQSDLTLILNAIGQYSQDHNGQLPVSIPLNTPAEITDGQGGANLCGDIMPAYLPSLPRDPKLAGSDIISCIGYDTGYTVVKDSYNRVTVSAPNTEQPPASAIITITR